MDINEEERKLCQELRDRISDLKIQDEFRIMDFNMARFLRARDHDLDKAEDMFRKYIAWRIENDIDSALTWDVPLDLKANFRYRVTGLTKKRGLVVCADVGTWDPSLSHGRYEDVMKVAFHEIENLTHFARYFITKTNTFGKMVAIINLEGLTFAHCTTVEWIKALITLLKAFEAYYPESLKRAYLVSAPWVFSILWSICKPFISTNTHQRLRFLSADKESLRAEISKCIDEDQFPERFGGSLPDDSELVFDEHGNVQRKCTGEGRDENINENDYPKPVDSIELD